MKKAEVQGLKFPKQVNELHQVYMQALIDEFTLNHRSEEFIEELIEVLMTFLFIK